MAPFPMQSVRSLIREADFEGQNFISINSMTSDQLPAFFELGHNLEPQNHGNRQSYPDAIVPPLFFQPSTCTRMNFETAMYRMGDNVIAENIPQTTSSTAKEESLVDMPRCASQYANIIVLRHSNDVDAREGVSCSSASVIDDGWGHWEHPTQVLLDLHTLRRKLSHVEGLGTTMVVVDMIEAHIGHSVAQGLAWLGAEVTIVSPKGKAVPREVTRNIKKNYLNAEFEEAYDFEKDSLNESIWDKDLIYLPGCSAPAGAIIKAFKRVMGDYSVKHETFDEKHEKGHMIYVTHTFPYRVGRMDLVIGDIPNQLRFKPILHLVPIRTTLPTVTLGA